MKNSNNTFDLTSLTRGEIKTILESLLFASSVDVCASFYKEESLRMFELAKKIREVYPDILLEEVSITPVEDSNGNEVYHDEHTSQIVEIFPEVFHNVILK
jgi:hypothetical protein